MLLQELGESAGELIEEFEPVPLGAASLAQCHKVLLKDGRTVAMKIQHPHVKLTCYTDIKTIEVWGLYKGIQLMLISFCRSSS